MTEYELVAGIETHVQLRTESKLFCGCSTGFGAPPNSHVCPVCLGHPGSLPVLNRRAFESGIRAALALNCEIAERTKFDRKHYFYPDLPKNYQISQYDMPLSRDGWVEIPGGRRIRILRAHMEEDAGKLVHEENGKRSLVDLNRAGMPLLEIVTQPDLRSPEEAYEYLTELKAILQYAGVSGCDMEKGELRCDLNLSIRPKGDDKLGVKTEIKNLNSFRFAREALAHEFERQKQVLASGGTIVQETRLYDPARGVTETMRTKEEAHDYRYFPEPDLPPVEVSREEVEKIRATLPEPPRARRERFIGEYGLSEYDAGILTDTRALADFFDECARRHGNPKTVANWVANELRKVLHEQKKEIEQVPFRPEHLAELVGMVDRDEINAATAKKLLPDLVAGGGSPAALVEKKGLRQVADTGALEEIAKKVVQENAKIADDYRNGKEAALNSLIGKIMKETRGRANPKVAADALKKLLS